MDLQTVFSLLSAIVNLIENAYLEELLETYILYFFSVGLDCTYMKHNPYSLHNIICAADIIICPSIIKSFICVVCSFCGLGENQSEDLNATGWGCEVGRFQSGHMAQS